MAMDSLKVKQAMENLFVAVVDKLTEKIKSDSCTPTDLNTARQMLRDNDIRIDDIEGEAMGFLEDYVNDSEEVDLPPPDLPDLSGISD